MDFNRVAFSFLTSLTTGAVTPELGSPNAVEKRWGGAIGLAARDLRDDSQILYRAGERFPLASTQNLPLVITALSAVSKGQLSFEQRIKFSQNDLEDFIKVAEVYPQGGSLTLRDTCRSTISYSDNTTADLLAPMVGGPPAVTHFLRSIGIEDIRIDRLEHELLKSDAKRVEPRDTTTPLAMLKLLTSLITDSPLSPQHTVMLLTWMRANKTGKLRLRAGVPQEWSVADKTGSYSNASNDVGFLYPPSGSPIAVAVYAFGQAGALDGSHAVAAIARLLAH